MTGLDIGASICHHPEFTEWTWGWQRRVGASNNNWRKGRD